jgi:hypothetical protein
LDSAKVHPIAWLGVRARLMSRIRG